MTARDVVFDLALENSWECEWDNGPREPPVTWKFQKQELADFAAAILQHAAEVCNTMNPAPVIPQYIDGFRDAQATFRKAIESLAREVKNG